MRLKKLNTSEAQFIAESVMRRCKLPGFLGPKGEHWTMEEGGIAWSDDWPGTIGGTMVAKSDKAGVSQMWVVSSVYDTDVYEILAKVQRARIRAYKALSDDVLEAVV